MERKIIDMDKLDEENFNLVFVNALRQFWRTTKSFGCVGNPKKENLLLYLNGCKITYTDKNGKVVVGNSGDVVYTPIGSEYTAELSDFSTDASHTVGINFRLADEVGSEAILSREIRVFHPKDTAVTSLLFQRATAGVLEGNSISHRIILLEILSFLTREERTKSSPSVEKAMRYLAEHIESNPSVAELASFSFVSEVYFRKQFKEAVGMSPSKYKNELRLNRAKAYLEFGDISVQEISDTLGFFSCSHFIRVFKERFGVSPLKYRKSGAGKP